jgi:hypothetical protein
MKATIEFRTMTGLAQREISFNKDSNPENEFNEIISKMPLFIKRAWDGIETETWSLQSHHITECSGNFWQAMEIKL